MDRTLSFKATAETAKWVDSHPGGRSAFLRELVERARQAEIDARDLAIIEAHGGSISDTEHLIDQGEWAAAASEWDGIDL